MKEEVKKEVREVLAEIQGDLITFKEACIRLEQAFERVAKVEEKFEPKDGDFFVSNNNQENCIGIYAEAGKLPKMSYYVCLSFGYIYQSDGSSCHLGYVENSRLATESEKQTLLDALAKEGKAWDAENKKVVKLRWRAGKFNPYYTVRTLMSGVAEILCCNESFQLFDTERYNIYNYYQTKEQAQAVADRINAIFAESL